MGLYINPKDKAKEEWLAENTVAIGFNAPTEARRTVKGVDLVVVCLVDNGAFTAAAVCYNQRELEAFNRPGDHRLKVWWIVPVDMVEAVTGAKLEDWE